MSNNLAIISNEVYDKLKKELDDFKSELREKSPDEIIKSAYELVAKEEILIVFNADGNFDLSQYKTILKTKNALDYLYNKWRDYDSLELNYFQECIRLAIDKQKEICRERAERNKDCR